MVWLQSIRRLAWVWMMGLTCWMGMIGMVVATPTDLMIEVIGSSARLWEDSDPQQAPWYESPRGTYFLVVDETANMWAVTTQLNTVAWILKHDAVVATLSRFPSYDRFGVVRLLPEPDVPPLEDGVLTIDAPIPAPSLPQDSTDSRLGPTLNMSVGRAPVTHPPLINVYNFQPHTEASFLFPKRPAQFSQQIEVDGFVETKLSGRAYNPKLGQVSATDNRILSVQRDPYYTRLPPDVLLGPLKFDPRLRFNIDARLQETLNVRFNVEMEPSFPAVYDVGVQYQDHKLDFFKVDTEFVHGEFIRLNRAITGAQYKFKDDRSQVALAFGQERSTLKKFESFGNGRRQYSVGVRPILSGSVRVWVNNTPQAEGSDYSVNYFDGEITFTTAKSTTDYIQIVYEFTNPIEDFIPVLSRKDFLGAQWLWQQGKRVVKTLETTRAEEVFLSKDVSENGLIKLNQKPIVLGSETLLMNGVSMTRDLDYIIRSRRGEIQLIRSLQSTDRLVIRYESYITQAVDQILIGRNANGPYQLEATPLVEGSLVVRVNGQLKTEINDYNIDYETGRLSFLYSIPYPSIISAKFEAIRVKTTETGMSQSPLSMGVTFLQQAVNTDGNGQILKVNQEVQAPSSNRFYLNNNPITLPEQVDIVVDGVPAPAGAVTLVNAHRGEFSVADAYVGKPLQIAYSYRRSYQTTAVLMGTGDKVYQHNINFNLKELPMKFLGLRKLRVFNGLVDEELQINQDFSIDYGANGIDVVITFYKEGDINPNSNMRSSRKQYPYKDQRITLVYDYAPEVGANSGRLVQKQIGVSLGTQLTDAWRVDFEVSGADNNFSKPRRSTEITVNGNGASGPYGLGKTNVVDSSELVFIDNVPMARDQDYMINYQQGTIRFLNVVPQSNHTIRVSFSYVDMEASTSAGEVQAMKFVGKMATSYQIGDVQFRGDFKTIDRDYNPLSPIQDRKGTTSFGGGMEYRVGGGFLSMDYRRRDEELPRANHEKAVFNHMDDFFIQGQITPLPGFGVYQNVRYTLNTQDPVGTSPNTYLIDNDLLAAETRVDFGPSDQKTQFRRSYTHSMDGVKDGFNQRSVITDGFDLSGLYTITQWWGVEVANFRPKYNQSTTLEYFNTAQSPIGLTKNHRSLWGLDSDIKPFRGWDITFSAQSEESYIESNGKQSTPNQLMNMRIRSVLVPQSWVNISSGYSLENQYSALLGQKGRKSTAADLSIDRFSMHGMLTNWGGDPQSAWVSVWDNSVFQLNWDERVTVENNDQNMTKSTGQGVSLKSFSPMKWISFPEFSIVKQLNQSLLQGTSQTYFKTTTYRDYELKTGRMTIDLPLPVLNHMVYRLDLSEKNEFNQSERTVVGATGNRTSEWTPSSKRVQGWVFRPTPFSFPWPISIDGIPLVSQLLKLNVSNPELSLDESFEWRDSRKQDVALYDGATPSFIQDFASMQMKSIRLGGTLWNWISGAGTLRETEDWFSRNVLQSNQGVTYRVSNELGTSARVPFPSFFGLVIDVSGTYTLGNLAQYRSPKLSILKDELVSPIIRNNPLLFTDVTEKESSLISGVVVVNPFINWIAIKGGYSINRIQEGNETPVVKTVTLFSDETITAGTSFTLFSGFTIGYDYSMKSSRVGNAPAQPGYTGVAAVSYTPFRSEFFNVTATYTRTDSWGIQLNTLQQSEFLRGTDDLIRTELVQRSDTVHVGNLSLNIIIPITGNPYIRNFTLTGEGYIKILTNNLDPVYRKYGLPEFSYDVSGVVIKGTLNF